MNSWDEMERTSLNILASIPVLPCASGYKRQIKLRSSVFQPFKHSCAFCSHLHTIAILIFPKHHFAKNIPTLKNLSLDFRGHPQYGPQTNDSTFSLFPNLLKYLHRLFLYPAQIQHSPFLILTEQQYPSTCTKILCHIQVRISLSSTNSHCWFQREPNSKFILSPN